MHELRALFVIALSLSCTASFDRSRVPVGFGAPTRGAAASPSGFDTCAVTNLEDGGAGSLRDCLVAGGREILFRVDGTITLGSELSVPSFVTIRGDTGDITLTRSGTAEANVFYLDGSEQVIIRGLRLLAPNRDASGALIITCGASGLLLDHLSVRNAKAGIVIGGGTTDTTLSNTLFVEGNTAINVQGFSTCSATNNTRVTIARNVFHRFNERAPRIAGAAREVQIVSNVVHGWHWFESGDAAVFFEEQSGAIPVAIDIVGNALLDVGGPSDAAVEVASGVTYYAENNRIPVAESDLGRSVSSAHTNVSFAADWESVLEGVGTAQLDSDERTALATVRSAL